MNKPNPLQIQTDFCSIAKVKSNTTTTKIGTENETKKKPQHSFPPSIENQFLLEPSWRLQPHVAIITHLRHHLQKATTTTTAAATITDTHTHEERERKRLNSDIEHLTLSQSLTATQRAVITVIAVINSRVALKLLPAPMKRADIERNPTERDLRCE